MSSKMERSSLLYTAQFSNLFYAFIYSVVAADVE